VTGFLNLSTSMTLNDLEASQKGFLVNFFAQFFAATRISRVNCAKMAGDRPRQFLAWNVDFSSPSPDPLGSSRPAHVSVNERYPVKSGYLYSVGLSSM